MGDLPVWAWILIAVTIPAAFTVWKLLGLRAAGVVAVIGGAAAVLARAKQSGYKEAKQENERDAWEQVNNAENARAVSYRDTADPERLREDDGYRRD